MSYTPHLITPFINSGISRYLKPFLIGDEAFEVLSDAYPWRGTIRKREGNSLLGTLPAGDKPIQGLKNWVSPSSFSEILIAFSRTKSYIWNGTAFQDITFTAAGPGAA